MMRDREFGSGIALPSLEEINQLLRQEEDKYPGYFDANWDAHPDGYQIYRTADKAKRVLGPGHRLKWAHIYGGEKLVIRPLLNVAFVAPSNVPPPGFEMDTVSNPDTSIRSLASPYHPGDEWVEWWNGSKAQIQRLLKLALQHYGIGFDGEGDDRIHEAIEEGEVAQEEWRSLVDASFVVEEYPVLYLELVWVHEDGEVSDYENPIDSIILWPFLGLWKESLTKAERPIGPPTTKDLYALRQEASTAGDRDMVQFCNAALDGNTEALQTCAEVMKGARAQEAAPSLHTGIPFTKLLKTIQKGFLK
jgi:hypothetical protein